MRKAENLQMPEQALHVMFQSFESASQRLEKKYEALLAETSRLRAEVLLKDQAIKKAEKLVFLGETAGALAHEVRNPLGAMKLFLSLALDEIEDTAAAGKYLQEVGRSIETLEQVVNNILHFARDVKVQPAPLNLEAVLRELSEQFKTTAPNYQINLMFADNSFLIGNASALRQVFFNLIQNSIQAAKGTGKLNIVLESSNGGIAITLQDDGPGLNEAVLAHLFEPFFTTRQEGTGLGLAIVKKIIEQHGGEIVAGNNAGAEFKIFLPKAHQS